MPPARPLAVTLDASPLRDGRGRAGIGRYVASLAAELRGVEGLDLAVSRPRRPPLRDAQALRFLGAQPALLATALRHRSRLVHVTGSEVALGWPPARQVVTVHDVVPWTAMPDRHPATRAYLGLQRRRFRRCAAVIVPSRAVAAEAGDALGLDPERVHVVPEGVAAAFGAEPDAGDRARRDAAGAPKSGYVLWTGSLHDHDPRKALDVLLDAVASLAGPAAAAPALVLAGRTGPEAGRVRDRARALGLELRLCGWVDDATLAALYRGAGAVAVPSLHEGFGLPLLEAMACGAPAVAARAGNLPDLAGEAALVVAPGDAAELGRALAAVLGGSGLADRLRGSGPRRAALFTWRAAAERTAAVYHAAA